VRTINKSVLISLFLLPSAFCLPPSARADVVRILDDPREAMQARVDVIEQARDKIETLYFLARDDRITLGVLALLRDAWRRGVGDVRVLVVTNSIRSTDGLLPQAAYLQYRHDLARAGIDFREYKGPETLHAKSIIVDGRVAMIGSYNIDPRSHFLNTEVMCVIDDEALADELLSSIEVHIDNAGR
jgi:phosphatidylserine/phosphatidylglycerophosphate/cardiolipin synthase-like enzyme